MDNPSEYYYNKGLDFLNEENYFEALMYLDKAIELDSNVAVYYADKAICLSKIEKFDEALEFIDKANELSEDIKIKSKKSEVFINIAEYNITKNELDKAEELIDKIIKLTPNNKELLNKKTDILIKKLVNYEYDDDEKLEIIDEILELDPKNKKITNKKIEILVNKLNNIELYENDEEKIMEVLDEILELDSKNTSYINKKTEILIKKAEEKTTKGKLDDSINYWNEIIDLNPENLEYIEKALYLVYEENPIKEVKKGKILNSQIRNLINSEKMCDKNQFEKKLEYINKSINIYESNKNLLNKTVQIDNFKEKAKTLTEMQKFDEAIKVVDEVLAEYDNEESSRVIKLQINRLHNLKSDILAKKAKILLNQENDDEALNLIDLSLELNNENNDAMSVKYDILRYRLDFYSSEYEKSINKIEEIINYLRTTTLENKDSLIEKELVYEGLCFRKIFKYENALECFDKVLIQNPLNFYAFFHKLEILIYLNNFEKAEDMLKREEAHKFVQFGEMKLAMLIRSKQFNAAEKLCENNIEEAKINNDSLLISIWNRKLLEVNSAKKSFISLDLINKGLKIENDKTLLKNKITCLYNISEFFKRLGHGLTALEYVDELIELDPYNPSVWKLKGGIFIGFFMNKEADECFQKALNLVDS